MKNEQPDVNKEHNATLEQRLKSYKTTPSNDTQWKRPILTQVQHILQGTSVVQLMNK